MAKKPQPKWWVQPFDEHDQRALKALNMGAASPEQQKIAVKWLVLIAAQTNEISFDPNNQRMSDFAEGRRSVGVQMLALIDGPMTEKVKP